MLSRSTDEEWKKYGKTDPYYGVVSLEKFHGDNLSQETVDEFFASGQDQIDFVLKTVRDCIDPDFKPTRALDFGCGVGRCLIPLARACDSAIGTDVSEGMLKEAQANADKMDVTNIELLSADDQFSTVSGQFNLVHSFAVFQHIRRPRGEKLFAKMVSLLEEKGVGAVQFIYDRRVSRAVKIMGYLRKTVPLLHLVINILLGEKASKPLMEKNCYNLNRLIDILRDNGCRSVNVVFEGKGEIRSLILLFQKDSNAEVYDYEAFFSQK